MTTNGSRGAPRLRPPPSPAAGSPLDLEKGYRHALIDVRRGTHPRRVVEGLLQRGFPAAQAQRLTAQAMEEVAEVRLGSARKQVALGAVALAAGLGLTLWSILDAADGGNVVVLFYGAIGFGGVELFAGLTTMRFWRARQDGVHDPAGPSSLRRRPPSA